jgi:hypothetical protein
LSDGDATGVRWQKPRPSGNQEVISPRGIDKDLLDNLERCIRKNSPLFRIDKEKLLQSQATMLEMLDAGKADLETTRACMKQQTEEWTRIAKVLDILATPCFPRRTRR